MYQPIFKRQGLRTWSPAAYLGAQSSGPLLGLLFSTIIVTGTILFRAWRRRRQRYALTLRSQALRAAAHRSVREVVLFLGVARQRMAGMQTAEVQHALDQAYRGLAQADGLLTSQLTVSIEDLAQACARYAAICGQCDAICERMVCVSAVGERHV